MIHTIHVPSNCKTLRIEISQMNNNSTNSNMADTPNLPEYKTDGTVKKLLNMLSECEKTPYVDERCEIAEKIFATILKKPEILLYEPKFRKVVIDKMDEIEESINLRIKDLKDANYNKALMLVQGSIIGHVRNTKMREQMFKYLNRLHNTIDQYSAWANGNNMMRIFNEIRAILHNIKSHPLYVADGE